MHSLLVLFLKLSPSQRLPCVLVPGTGALPAGEVFDSAMTALHTLIRIDSTSHSEVQVNYAFVIASRLRAFLIRTCIRQPQATFAAASILENDLNLSLETLMIYSCQFGRFEALSVGTDRESRVFVGVKSVSFFLFRIGCLRFMYRFADHRRQCSGARFFLRGNDEIFGARKCKLIVRG